VNNCTLNCCRVRSVLRFVYFATIPFFGCGDSRLPHNPNRTPEPVLARSIISFQFQIQGHTLESWRVLFYPSQFPNVPKSHVHQHVPQEPCRGSMNTSFHRTGAVFRSSIVLRFDSALAGKPWSYAVHLSWNWSAAFDASYVFSCLRVSALLGVEYRLSPYPTIPYPSTGRITNSSSIEPRRNSYPTLLGINYSLSVVYLTNRRNVSDWRCRLCVVDRSARYRPVSSFQEAESIYQSVSTWTVKAGITRLNGLWNFYQDLRHGITSVPMAGSPPGAVLLRDVLWRIKNPIPETAWSGASHGLQLTCLWRSAYESSVPGNYMHLISNTTSLSTFSPHFLPLLHIVLN
jgi:hypothetical protein